MTMVKAIFSFFEVQLEDPAGKTFEFSQSEFGKSPKRFNPVNMGVSSGKLVAVVINTVMLLIAEIHEAVVSAPTVRIKYAVKSNSPLNHRRKSGSGDVAYNLGIDFPIPLEQPEDGHFLESTPTFLLRNSFAPKVGLIHFYRSYKRRGLLTLLRQSLPQQAQITVDCVAIQSCQLGYLQRFHIQAKILY